MSAPVGPPQMNGAPQRPPLQLGAVTPQMRSTLVESLGNAAEQAAQKGAMADDGSQASAFGSAALSYVQAIVALITPPQAPQAPQNASSGPAGPPQPGP